MLAETKDRKDKILNKLYKRRVELDFSRKTGSGMSVLLPALLKVRMYIHRISRNKRHQNYCLVSHLLQILWSSLSGELCELFGMQVCRKRSGLSR